MSETVALVTGASSGLGLACTLELLKRKIPTLMVARQADVLRQRSAELSQKIKVPVYTLSADVGSPTDVQRIKRVVAEQNLQVKWLINNAGVGRYGELSKYSAQDIDETLNANLRGMIFMCQAFQEMVMANQGIICNVMSTAALNYRASETVYTAAKWGARGFTEALRAELKGKPIRIMAVYPGGMNTPFWEPNRHYAPDTSKFMSPLVVAERIIGNMFDAEACQVSDITINRL